MGVELWELLFVQRFIPRSSLRYLKITFAKVSDFYRKAKGSQLYSNAREGQISTHASRILIFQLWHVGYMTPGPRVGSTEFMQPSTSIWFTEIEALDRSTVLLCVGFMHHFTKGVPQILAYLCKRPQVNHLFHARFYVTPRKQSKTRKKRNLVSWWVFCSRCSREKYHSSLISCTRRHILIPLKGSTEIIQVCSR